MKASGLGRWVLLGSAALALGGCYTVLTAPLSGPELQGPAVGVDQAGQGQAAPRLSGSDDADRADDWYGYPRYGGYGGGYAGSVYGLGYDSWYGHNPYFGYGYGYPYGYGYGPYSYGYDPYYYGSMGTYYVPAGYSLVTDRELDELRSYSQAVSAAKEADPAAAAREQVLREAQIRKEQQAWDRRTDPQDRPAPETTPKPAVQPPPPPPPAKSAAPAPADKGSAQPKKTRR